MFKNKTDTTMNLRCSSRGSVKKTIKHQITYFKERYLQTELHAFVATRLSLKIKAGKF